MAPNKRTCPNGHKYDSTIYGDNCPFCPNPTTVSGGATSIGGERTMVNPAGGGNMTSVPTIPVNPVNEAPSGGGHTVIRPVGGDNSGETAGRCIVGLLVSYSVDPCGKVYNLYEGRNTIGRDVTNDISFPSDNSVSQQHLIIVYRAADDRFLMEDQLTSNGTWLNGEFAGDRVALHSGDIVVIGGTKFVFLAIPKGL